MIRFSVFDYPKFCDYVLIRCEYDVHYQKFDQALISEGFSSAMYVHVATNESYWCMSDEQFTWFILKWS